MGFDCLTSYTTADIQTAQFRIKQVLHFAVGKKWALL